MNKHTENQMNKLRKLNEEINKLGEIRRGIIDDLTLDKTMYVEEYARSGKNPYFMIAFFHKINEDMSTSNEYIAKALGMKLDSFRKTMVEEFNGNVHNGKQDVRFYSLDDAAKATDWINSRLVMRQIKTLSR